jgi:hypothetical protein
MEDGSRHAELGEECFMSSNRPHNAPGSAYHLRDKSPAEKTEAPTSAFSMGSLQGAPSRKAAMILSGLVGLCD